MSTVIMLLFMTPYHLTKLHLKHSSPKGFTSTKKSSLLLSLLYICQRYQHSSNKTHKTLAKKLPIPHTYLHITCHTLPPNHSPYSQHILVVIPLTILYCCRWQIASEYRWLYFCYAPKRLGGEY
jgi:hypothetical protein